MSLAQFHILAFSTWQILVMLAFWLKGMNGAQPTTALNWLSSESQESEKE